MGHRSFSLRLIGYWRSKQEPHWPDPVVMIDDTMSAKTRDLVAHYLRAGQATSWIAAGYSSCRICGKPNGTRERTDGTFLWPDGLAHYVAEHSVRLPDELISLAEAWADPAAWDIDRQWWQNQAGH
jgi:hypothetical protein